MKASKYLLGLILLSIFTFGLSIETRAAYSLEGSTGTSLQMDVTISGMTMRATFTIQGTTSTGNGWDVSWSASGAMMGGGSIIQEVYSNPTLDPDGVDLYNDYDFIIPTPVEQYLAAMAIALGYPWSASGNKIYYQDGIKSCTSEYDPNTGLLVYYLYQNNGVTYMEAKVYNPIMEYVIIFVVIGVIVAVPIIAIVVIRKKRKSSPKSYKKSKSPTYGYQPTSGYQPTTAYPPPMGINPASTSAGLFCPNCGLKQTRNTLYCSNCGAYLEEK